MCPAILHFSVILATLAMTSYSLADDFSSKYQQLLSTKTLSKTADEISRLQSTSSTSQQQAALGITQFFQAIEFIGQEHYRYGVFYKDLRSLPLMRLPVPVNENPEPITYEKASLIFSGIRDRLEKAEKTLAEVNDPSLKLSFPVFLVLIDYNNNGREDRDETLGELLLNLNPTFMRQPGQDPLPVEILAEQFVIGFDQADVYWLRGYCHLLMSFCDFMLAHDAHDLYHVLAPRIYANPTDAAPMMPKGEEFIDGIADAIAGIHLARFPVVHPEKYQSCHGHLKSVIDLSRKCWESALAETDNDREWLPNPKQTGLLEIPITDEMIDTWKNFLAESEEILDGKKLVAHWRYPAGTHRGINLKRFFSEPPKEFDLILMVHGVAFQPYIEKGELTSPETWEEFNNLFGGNFMGYAIWIN